MPSQGFTDANGRTVGIGDYVQYERRPGSVAEVTDITQDGDVKIKFRNLESETVKWGRVAKLPQEQQDAFREAAPALLDDRFKREPFWMVYGERQGAPRATHGSKIAAITEAQRLARSAPGTGFFVLEAVAGFIIAEPPVQALDIDPEFIPF
jgi:hypothetical protein